MRLLDRSFASSDPSDFTLNRIGEDSFILVTAAGAIMGTARNGIDEIPFKMDSRFLLENESSGQPEPVRCLPSRSSY